MPDRKRLEYLHRLMDDWGKWLLSGRSVPGLFPNTWPDLDSGIRETATGARSRTKHPRPLLPPCQPHSTRQRPSSTIIMVTFERDLESIHPVIMSLATDIQRIIVCLYLRGMCFSDINKNLGISSRKIGDAKYKALKAVSLVVR